MRDPREGVAPDGTIVTGVDRRAVPPAYESVLTALQEALAAWPTVSSYLDGSVATGQARPGRSDDDVLTVGLPRDRAADLGRALTGRFAGLAREVALAPAQPADLVGDDDPAYGMRVFVRHYCVHLGGPEQAPGGSFRADARAARGFNGDIDHHLRRWRRDRTDPDVLGRRIARKTLLATAGLVSVLDSTWTTDRALAADRYRRHRPDLADGLAVLLAWSDDESTADTRPVREVLAPDGVVAQLVADVAARVGLWRSPPSP